VRSPEKRKSQAYGCPQIIAILTERKEEIISLTINVNDIRTASKEIEKALTELKGKIIKTKTSSPQNLTPKK
jgi:hypothetical protein